MTESYLRDEKGRFIKGNPQPHGFGTGKQEEPWNKGNHIQCNTGRTHFKNGHTDTQKENSSQWQGGKSRYWHILVNGVHTPEHRYIWEQVNGEIPEGYVIHHINNNPKDNRIENLQCMTSADHTRLHNKYKSIEVC